MPCTTIRCCGTSMTIEEALEHTADRSNSCEWTYELLSAMLTNRVAHPSNDDPTRISTTSLTSKCKRQMALERYTNYTLEPSDMWASFRGTQMHGQLESFMHPGCYGEVRFVVHDVGVLIPSVKKALPRKDRSFSGSPDLVDPTVGILYDYKRTKEVPRFNYPWGDHVEQLNINRWLCDKSDLVEVKAKTADQRAEWVDRIGASPVDYDDERAQFAMNDADVRKFFVPMDWQELVIVYVDDKGPKPLTVTESIDVPTADGKRTKKARVPAVWTDEEVEALIAQRYVEVRLALETGNAPIPEGWEHQSHILCGYCPVRHLCASLEAEGE